MTTLTMTKYFTFAVPPVPASRPRVTRWGTYYGKKYNDYKDNMRDLLKSSEYPITQELLEVEVLFYVQIPKSWSSKKKEKREGTYCDNNADIDNYLKAIFDSLNGVLYEDDKQIVRIKNSEKRYSSTPRTEFSFNEVKL